jgi:predicted N-acetyltransferase YhbS
MSAIQIRLAEEADNEKIIQLSERCPQEGVVTIFINRTPRFNTLHKLMDPTAWHFVACKDDEIIGLVGVIHFKARVLDKPCKIGYMLDLRVDKAYRSGITAFKLVRTAVDYLQKSDADMVIANFLKDNKRPLVFTSGRGGLPPALFLGDNRVLNLLPLRKLRLSERFVIEKPSESDIPELVALYQKYAEGFKIAPVFDEAHFRNIINTVEGLSFDAFLVAKENGKIRAVTAAWDEHPYKSYQVLKLNLSIRVVTWVLRFLSLFMKTPYPIKLNEPLRQLSLVLYAHDNCPEALEQLFRQVNNQNIGANYTMITLYAQENDPVFKLVRKFTGVSVKSEMHMFAKDMSVFDRLRENPDPVMFDLVKVL